MRSNHKQAARLHARRESREHDHLLNAERSLQLHPYGMTVYACTRDPRTYKLWDIPFPDSRI